MFCFLLGNLFFFFEWHWYFLLGKQIHPYKYNIQQEHRSVCALVTGLWITGAEEWLSHGTPVLSLVDRAVLRNDGLRGRAWDKWLGGAQERFNVSSGVWCLKKSLGMFPTTLTRDRCVKLTSSQVCYALCLTQNLNSVMLAGAKTPKALSKKLSSLVL